MKIAIIGSSQFTTERNIIQQYLQAAGHQVLSTAFSYRSSVDYHSKFAFEAVDLANVRDADVVILVDTSFENIWQPESSYIGEHTWRCIEQAQVLSKQILTLKQVGQALTVGSPFFTFPQNPERAEYFNQLHQKWQDFFPPRPEQTPQEVPIADPESGSGPL